MTTPKTTPKKAPEAEAQTTEARSSYAVVQVGDGRFRRWEISGPGLPPASFATRSLTERAAARLAVLIRNEDAWAFELEQVSHISMTRIAQVGDALRVFAGVGGALREHAEDTGRHKWADMTPDQRVRALTVAGYARYAFDEKMGHRSMSFAVRLARAQMNASVQRHMDMIGRLAVHGYAIVETTAEEQA